MDETVRTLEQKFGLQPCDTEYLISELREHFPDAWAAPGYRELIPAMPNDANDRHVVAAAVKENCEVIVTYNLRDFPANQLQRFNITAMHPDEFLTDIYWLSPETVVQVLHEQGEALKQKKSLEEVLGTLGRFGCTRFTSLVKERLDL